jgi:ABC-type Fe3+-siderophore transport system permease subunit
MVMIGWFFVRVSGPALDALTRGEETATSLGVNLSPLRLQLIYQWIVLGEAC